MGIFKNIIFVLVFLLIVSASSQTVYKTKTGEKYHKSSCHYLKYSKVKLDLSVAIAQGYFACIVCKPSKRNLAESQSLGFTSSQNNSSSKKTTATQCTGKTQAGKRCKRKTKINAGSSDQKYFSFFKMK